MAERKVSEAQRKATDKYLEKFDEIRIRVPAGRKSEIKAHAEKLGQSMNSFVINAIDEAMKQ